MSIESLSEDTSKPRQGPFALSGVTSVFLTKVLLFIINFGTSVLTARVLGPTGKGQYALLTLIPTMAYSMVSLGLGEAIIYFLSRRRFAIDQVLIESLIAGTVLGVLGICVFGGIYWLGWVHWDVPSTGLFLVALASVPILLSRHYAETMLIGLKRFGQFNTLNILVQVSLAVALLFLVGVLRTGVGGAVLSWLMVQIGAATLAIIWLRSRAISYPISQVCADPATEPDKQACLQRKALRKLVNMNNCSERFLVEGVPFGLRAHIGNMAQYYNMRLDQAIIGSTIGATSLGFYSLAVNLTEIIWMLPDAIGVVLLPEVAAAPRGSAKMAATVSRLAVTSVILSGVGLGLLARPLIILVYGHEFLPSVPALWLLLPGVVFLSISKLLSKYQSGVGKPVRNTYASLVCFGLTVSLCLLLIPRWGIEGAAAASSLAYAGHALVELIFFRRESGLGARNVLILQRADFGAVCKQVGKKAGIRGKQ